MAIFNNLDISKLCADIVKETIGKKILLHPFIFWFLFVSSFLFLGIALYYIWIYYSEKWFKDYVILISSSNRFRIVRMELKNKSILNYENKKYYLKEDCALLNSSGKLIYVFSENKPTPLKISYNKVEWLTSDTLMASINNELIKLMVKPKEKLLDILIIIGSIASIICCFICIFIVAKIFGYIK